MYPLFSCSRGITRAGRRLSRRWLLLGCAVALLFAGLAAPPRAWACSGSTTPQERAAVADVIVLGQVTSLQILEPAPDHPDHPLPARVWIRVEQELKGEVDSFVSYVDRASIFRLPRDEGRPGRLQFLGSGGGCGTLDLNPTGMYVAALLDRREDGALSTSVGSIVFVDERSELNGALEYFGLPAGLPATGSGGPSVPYEVAGRALQGMVTILCAVWLGRWLSGRLLRR